MCLNERQNKQLFTNYDIQRGDFCSDALNSLWVINTHQTNSASYFLYLHVENACRQRNTLQLLILKDHSML